LLAARAALADLKDPEIPTASIVEMGMVRDVRDEAGAVVVEVIPTFSGCPAIAIIEQDIQRALLGAGITAARVVLRGDLPWSTDMITEAGRRQVAAHGIIPPQRGRLKVEEISCPQCNLRQVTLTSRFGTTPCRAMARCRNCGEPLEVFKPIGSTG
ncbi:MAG: phenylacetate-CoA oxygenase subunit PaaJ, partial [Candidatus Dormibacteraeota bacterium]|nr:phenylacetate-CoA oxygenase subunit PaaJ [Candidatus Dormibacteraeota bacterium]